jgi:hypothetical protein
MAPRDFTEISPEILKSKKMGSLGRGTATASQILATRVACGKGRGWERQEGTKLHVIAASGGEVVDRGGSRAWDRAGGSCGCWWLCSGEEEGAGTSHAASV